MCSYSIAYTYLDANIHITIFIKSVVIILIVIIIIIPIIIIIIIIDSEGILQLGQRVEALDKTNKWLEAFVIEISIDENKVKVHYKGWHLKFDQWVNVNAHQIRPYGRHKPSAVHKKTREQVR